MLSSTQPFGPTKATLLMLKWEKSWITIHSSFHELVQFSVFPFAFSRFWCLVFHFWFSAFRFFCFPALLFCCIKTAFMYRIANANKCKVPHPKVHFYFASTAFFALLRFFARVTGCKTAFGWSIKCWKLHFICTYSLPPTNEGPLPLSLMSLFISGFLFEILPSKKRILVRLCCFCYTALIVSIWSLANLYYDSSYFIFTFFN